jgi:cell division protein FtsL
MSPSRKKIVVGVITYAIIAAIAILSLVVNIRTVPFIEKRQDVILETQRLKEENRKLEFIVVSANALNAVERIATRNLNMSKPRKIIYIDPQ